MSKNSAQSIGFTLAVAGLLTLGSFIISAESSFATVGGNSRFSNIVNRIINQSHSQNQDNNRRNSENRRDDDRQDKERDGDRRSNENRRDDDRRERERDDDYSRSGKQDCVKAHPDGDRPPHDRPPSDVPVEQVPEPMTILGTGAAVGFGAWLKRRKQNDQE